jgi:5-bromo-4-chloroindolyl phosphate hydrolysis protein
MTERYVPSKKNRRLKGVLLYLLPLPLLPASLGALSEGNIENALACGVGFALSMLAAVLTRKANLLEAKSAERKILRRASTLPYKLLSGLSVSCGIMVVCYFAIDKGLITSLIYGLVTFLGFYLYYGLDPSRKNPHIAAIGVTAEEIITLIEEAEIKISAIELARKKIHNIELNDRLRKIVKGVRKVLTMIENDPRDARRARKFLHVYLDGAKQVTEGYAQTHKYGDAPELEDNFRRVLESIENVVIEQQQKLLENNLSELDVTIEVLQMQLEKEGIT